MKSIKFSREPGKKNNGRNIFIIIVILALLFGFKDRISDSFRFLEGMTQAMNFKLVNVKSMIYTQTLKFKSKVKDISYTNDYIESNKRRDFELQKSKIENMELQNLKKENEKLRAELDMRSKKPSEYVAADVALVETFNTSERIFIDKGRNQAIELNLPVMYNGFLIGKVTKVGENYSEVTLITSKNSRYSVALNGTNTQILRGNGNGTFSIINFNEDINVKDIFDIETSGISDIFPRGLKIGTFYIKELNAFKQIKEMRFKPSYNIYDIQSVLVYKWSKNDLVNQEIQKQIDFEIQEEYKKNKGTTQIN